MRLFMVMVLICSAVLSGAAPRVQVIEYHNQPPFVIDAREQTGFSFELVHLLNQQSTELQFDLVILPKARAQYQIEDWIFDRCFAELICDDHWLMLWTTPKWGWGELAEQKYLWQPLFIDSNVIVLNKADGIDYQGPHSLIGYRLGGLIGHQYVDFDPLVHDGKIEREDSADESSALLRILRQRVNAVIMQHSTFDYYQKREPFLSEYQQLTASEKGFASFVAASMMPPNRSDLQQSMAALVSSDEFKALLTKYDLSDVASTQEPQ